MSGDEIDKYLGKIDIDDREISLSFLDKHILDVYCAKCDMYRKYQLLAGKRLEHDANGNTEEADKCLRLAKKALDEFFKWSEQQKVLREFYDYLAKKEGLT